MNQGIIPSLTERILLGISGTAAFYIVYGGADYLVKYLRVVEPIQAPAEPQWPFVPALSLIYLSLILVISSLPLVMRSTRKLQFAATLLGTQLIIAFPFFVLLPLEPLPPIVLQGSSWDYLITFLDTLNMDYNLFPSLHVSFALSCAYLLRSNKSPLITAAWWAWAGAVALSTLLLHQHYLIDVLGGSLLMIAAARISQKLLSNQ